MSVSWFSFNVCLISVAMIYIVWSTYISIPHLTYIAVYLETFQAPSLCTDISGMWGSTTSEASLFCLALFLYSFKTVQRGSGYSLLKYPLIFTSTVAIRILNFHVNIENTSLPGNVEIPTILGIRKYCQYEP